MTPLRRVPIILAALAAVAFTPALAKPTVIHGAVLCYAGYGDGIEVGSVAVQPNIACPSGASAAIGTTSTGEWVWTFPEDCLGGYTSVTLAGETKSLSVPMGSTVAFPYWRKFCEGDPFPGTSVVPNVVYSPGGTLTYTVTVRDLAADPVAGATVRLEPTAAADGLINWCSGQSHEPTATTNSLGQASFQIAAGGCIDPARLGDDAFRILAEYAYVPGYNEEVQLAARGSLSSDAVNLAGYLPTDPLHEVDGGSGVVSLSDAVFHTGPLSTGTYEFCSDFDSDGVIGLSDATIVTGDLVSGPICTLE